MFKKIAIVAALTLTPAVAFAQSQPSGGAVGGATSGAAAGAVGGAVVGGPVGAVVGGVGGAVVGAIVGDAAQPRFRTYVVEQQVPSYTYAEPVAVGTVLPEEGVVYHRLPAEYGPQATRYNYTVVNDRTVIVDPRTPKARRRLCPSRLPSAEARSVLRGGPRHVISACRTSGRPHRPAPARCSRDR